MPRRPPPTPLVLAKGPLPPRGAPRHQLPDVPCAALIVAETAYRHSYHNNAPAIALRLGSRERSVSNASTSSLPSNLSSLSLSYDDPPLVSIPAIRMRVTSLDTTMMPTWMSSSWVALDAARGQVTPPPPVMLAYPTSRSASGSGMKTGSRRVSF